MYYRIVPEYLGENVIFKPEKEYEKVDIVNGKIVEVDYGIKEVCFSKSITGCFFAIANYLKEDTKYYIYKSQQKPCIDLSNSNIGDFNACLEVRYRKNVAANIIGTYVVDEYFLRAIQSLYDDCIHGDFFDNIYATKMLNEHYSRVYEDIEYIDINHNTSIKTAI